MKKSCTFWENVRLRGNYQRPLSKSMLEYAAMDVSYLSALYQEQMRFMRHSAI
jgi:hypothetical protein